MTAICRTTRTPWTISDIFFLLILVVTVCIVFSPSAIYPNREAARHNAEAAGLEDASVPVY